MTNLLWLTLAIIGILLIWQLSSATFNIEVVVSLPEGYTIPLEMEPLEIIDNSP